jgi:hypothetical protein
MVKLGQAFSVFTILAVQAKAACTRELLSDVATDFIKAAKADGFNIKKSAGLVYTENYRTADITKGVYSKAINIAHTRTLLDGPGCAIYAEVLAPDNKPGYQLGTQVFVSEDGTANKVEVIVTSNDSKWPSWFYNAKRALDVLRKEETAGQRKVIPEAQRVTREHLKAVADQYFNAFGSKGGKIPVFSKGCMRQEGKHIFRLWPHITTITCLILTFINVGGFAASMGCSVAVPKPNQDKGTMPQCSTTSPVAPHPYSRGYVIDETVGSVEVFSKFAGAPDSHDFRVENCEVVLVHAVTTTDGGTLGGGRTGGGSAAKSSGPKSSAPKSSGPKSSGPKSSGGAKSGGGAEASSSPAPESEVE